MNRSGLTGTVTHHAPQTVHILAAPVGLTFLASLAWGCLFYGSIDIGALLITVATKWAIIGRATVGNHNWDTSSYCQRWQLHKTFHPILAASTTRGNALTKRIMGSQWLVWFFNVRRIGNERM